jgi:methylated-DNA-[protein]-cysteine S-methyltransferase
MTTTDLLVTALTTPVGPLAVVITAADGVVRAAGFDPVGPTVERLPAALRAGGIRELTEAEAGTEPAFGVVVDAVRRYAAGDGAALDDVPAQQPGGPFFQAAWAAMRAIPAGRTVSYAELAAAAGRPSAVRAAGSACARNLLAPFVPCHRVLRTSGDLGGYYYGLGTKRALLGLERRSAAPAGAGEAGELELGLGPQPVPATTRAGRR